MAIEQIKLLDGSMGERIMADICVAVADFAERDKKQLLKVLVHSSGREVSLGMSGQVLYAYYSDGDLTRAHAGQLDAETTAYCTTQLRRGSYDVSNTRIILRKGSYCTASLEEVRAAARVCKLSFWNDEQFLLITWLGEENTPAGCAKMINRMQECFPEKFEKSRKRVP